MRRPSPHSARTEGQGAEKRLPAWEDLTTRLVDLSAYYGHLDCFRDLAPLIVKTNRFTYAPSYPPNRRMQNTWLSIALEGIGTLFAQRGTSESWNDIAVLGTGNGLDVVGISRIVQPRTVVASDIHPKALEAARWNIANYVGEKCRVAVLESDLFGNYPPEAKFDLIYENLPNIPDGKELFEGIRSASCFEPRPPRPQTSYDRHLLTLHHDFLVQARPRLRPSGWVVGVIGGRVPAPVIAQLFRDSGLSSHRRGLRPEDPE